MSQHCEPSANAITHSDIVDANSNRADAIATGLDSSMIGVSHSNPLFEWWDSLFEKSPRAEEHMKESCFNENEERSKPVWRKLS